MKARPLSVSLARFGSACAMCVALAGAAEAATLYWDADGNPVGNTFDGTGLGGSGTWNTSTSNWWAGALANQIWNNAANDTAIFGGTSGAIILANPGMSVGNLVFRTSGFSLAGATPATTTLTLAGANPIIGLNARNGGPVDVTISAKLAGTGGFVFNGNAGTMFLDHAGTHTLTGAMRLHSGTVAVRGTNSVLDSALGLTFRGSSSFSYDNTGATTNLTQTLGALSFESGEGRVNIDRVVNGLDVTLSFTSMTRAEGATGLFHATGFSPTLGASVDFTIAGLPGGVTFLPGLFARTTTGAAGFAVYDSGDSSIRALNHNLDAATLITGGAFTTGSRHVSVTGNVSNQTGIAAFSLAMSGGATSFGLAGSQTLTISNAGTGPGSILKTGGNTVTFSGGTGVTAGGGRELIIRPDAAADTVVFNNSILNTTGALTKTGDGTLTLNGTQSFTGTTYVNGGKLTINGLNARGSGAGVTIGGGTYEMLASGDGTTTAETIAIGKNLTILGTATLAVDKQSGSAANKTLTFGTLSVGNQVFTVSPGSNYRVQFTGATTLRDDRPATLAVGGTQPAGTTPGLTLGGQVTGPQGLIKRGSGTLALTDATNTFGGPDALLEVQEGLLSFNSAGALGNGSTAVVLNTLSDVDGLVATGGAAITTGASRGLVLAGTAGSINVDGAGTSLQWDGVVSSQGPTFTLVKSGAGTLALTNAGNSFGGTGSLIDVRAGNLTVAASGALGAAANTLNLNTSGTTTFVVPNVSGLSAAQAINFATENNALVVSDPTASGGALTLSGVVSSSATGALTITKTGPGGLILTNALNTFGGASGGTLDIQGGNLTVTSAGALGGPTNTIRLTQNGTTEKFVADGTSTARQNFVLAQPAGTSARFEVTAGNTFGLTGALTMSDTSGRGFVKLGGGTLVLGNPASTFGGPGQIVDIQQGVLAVGADGALGNVGNAVRLSATSAAEGLLVQGTFSSARTFQLANLGPNGIDVSQGNTATLTTAFARPNGEAAELVKNGPGRLTLSVAQAPAWTGAVTINAGAIRLNSASNQLGATSTGTTINNQGGLEIVGGFTAAEPLVINMPGSAGDSTAMVGPDSLGVLRGVGSGTSTLTGAITLNAALTDNTTRTFVIGNEAANTFVMGTGPLTVNNGAGPASRVVNLNLTGESANANSFNNTIVKNGGTLNLVKTGSGRWQLAPTAATGHTAFESITIRGGTLQVNGAAPAAGGSGAVLTNTVPVAIGGSGVFAYSNSGTANDKTQNLGALTLLNGDSTIRVDRGAGFGNVVLGFSSLSARPEGATAVFQATGSGANFAGGSPTTKVTLTGVANGFISPAYVSQILTTGTPAFAFYNTTTATVRPMQYGIGGDPGTATSNATTSFVGGSHLLLSTSVSAQNSTSVLSLQWTANGGNLVLGANQTLTINSGGAGGLLKTGGNGTISGGTGLTAGGGQELIIRTESNLDITTSILNTTGALTKAGGSTLTLSGNNAWTGATYINGGTLALVGNSALAGSSALTLGGGTLSVSLDGDGRGSTEQLNLGKNVTVTSNGGITVGKTSAPASQALNKTVQFGSLNIGPQIFTATVNNQYGVEFTGAVTMNDLVPTTFSVSGIHASNVVQGLTLSGVVSGTAGLIKTGTGTLALTNAGNTFGGSSATIEIQNGILAAASDGALGNAANRIVISVPSNANGFRATGTFATNRVFTLNSAAQGIEVTQGQVLSVNQPLNVISASATLEKRDNGVLELGADSPVIWTGTANNPVNITGGALRLKTGGGLGGPANRAIISTSNTALQLSGSNVIYNAYPTTLVGTGLSSGGALENVSGSNAWTGVITLTGDTTIGASAGTLTIQGGINKDVATQTRNLTLGGAGNVVINTVGLSGLNSLTKVGTGTATIATASPAFVENVTVSGGTFALRGSGAAFGTVSSGARSVTVNAGGTLQIDDSVGAPLQRLGSRAITLNAGRFAYQGSSTANSAETFGALRVTAGNSTITSERGAGRTVTLSFPEFGLDDTSTNPVSNFGFAVTDASVAVTGVGLGSPEHRILSTDLPRLSSDIMPRVTVNGADFATYATAQTLKATTGAGDNIVTLTTGDTGQLVIGQAISGNPAIPAGARVAAVLSSTLFTITVPATVASIGADTSFALGGLAAFASYERATDIMAAAVTGTDTFLASQFTIGTTLTASKTMNAIKLDATSVPGGTLTIGGSALTQLGLNSGAILATGGTSVINVSVISFADQQGIVHVDAGSTLTLGGSLINGSGNARGFVKAGAGLLVLDTAASAVPGLGGNTALVGTHAINAGTLKLGNVAGSLDNVLATGVAMRISPGATLDLNGNVQVFGPILSEAAVAGTGGALGLVTSNSGTGTLVANLDNTARNWAANIAGSVAFSRGGQNTFTVFSPQTYSGPTQIVGGATVLRDAGTLEGTSALDLNFATLTLDDAGGTQRQANRVSNSAAVILRGGTLNLIGRPITESLENFSSLTLRHGLSTLTVNASSGSAVGSSVASAEMNFTSLTRDAGALVNFIGQVNGAAGNLGRIGSAARITFNTAPTLTNNLIGGWAIVTGASSIPEFASYAAGVGVGALGDPGFQPYDKTNFTSTVATDNVRLTAAPTISGTSAAANSLNIIGNFTPGITFSSGTTRLNLTSGGLIRSGATAAHAIGSAALPGELTSGGTGTGLSELVIYQGNSTQVMTIFPKIVNNGNGTGTTALVLGGTGTMSLAAQANNTHTGGTTINGIAVNTTGAVAGAIVFPNATNPARGLILSNATLTLGQTGQIGTSNVVTLNGPSVMILPGNTTLGGLVFDNTGGTGTPEVRTFTSGLPDGTLSLGTAGVTASSSNVSSVALINGRLDLGNNSASPFVINPVLFNARDVSPTTATLAVTGITNPAGGGVSGIAKSGAGVLQFNAQTVYTGPTTLTGGGIQYGVGNAGSRFSTVDLGAGTRLNLNGFGTFIGGLAGSGVVTNASNTDATLNFGFNGANTAFSGQIRGISDGNQNSIFIAKIGAGTTTFTGFSDSTGDLAVRGGTLLYQGSTLTSGKSSFTNNTVITGGTLRLNNAAGNVNNRLGGSTTVGTLSISGGAFEIAGNNSADTTESFRTFNVQSGSGVVTLTPSGSRQLNVRVGTSFGGVTAGGTVLIRGISEDVGPGLATFFGGGPSVAFGAPAGAGFGSPPSQLPIRPDMIGDTAPTGSGTGFLTKDAGNGMLRLLRYLPGNVDTELEDNMAITGVGFSPASPTNFQISTPQLLTENRTAYSVTMLDGSTISRVSSAAQGIYGANGGVLTNQVLSGGVLSVEDAQTLINVGLLQSGTNVPLFLYANGATGVLTVNSSVASGSGGLTKSGSGKLVLGGRGLYTGLTAVNAGTLEMNGAAANNIAVIPGATTPILSQLVVNGGTLDLKGRSQVFGALTTNNPLAGAGGTITNTGALTTLVNATGTGTTFSGTIAGGLNFESNNNNSTLILSNASSYTGTTTVRGGTLQLVDQGRLTGTSSISLNYGQLLIDHRGLTPAANVGNLARVPATAAIDMQGATLTLFSGGSMDATGTVGTGTGVSLAGGANTITAGVTQNAGSTTTLTIGNLVRSGAATSTVNFTPNGGTLGSPGFNNPSIVVSQLNGGAVPLGSLLGPWAVANGSNWAVARTGNQIGEMGVGAFVGYDATDLTAAGTLASANVNDSTSRTLTTTKTISTLRVGGGVTHTLNAALTLGAGGLLKTGDSTYTINGTGSLTSGTSSLFSFINQSTTTVAVPIVGNGMSLIKSGGGTLELTAVNTYTGQTVVNQGLLRLNNGSADGAAITTVPGDLLINNATTTLVSGGQLKTTAQVTLDGAATLNMSGINTLSRLVFNNRGGNSNPTVNTSTRLDLSSSTPITSTNNSYVNTPVIAGNELRLTNAAPTITTNGASPNNLALNSPIHVAGGQITKAGPGSVSLNPTIGAAPGTTASGNSDVTFIPEADTARMRVGMIVTGAGIPAGTTIAEIYPSNTAIRLSQPATANGNGVSLNYFGSTTGAGFRVSEGSLIFAQSSALNETGTAVASGPVGTGTLTLANNAALLSDNTVRTIHNPIFVEGNFTLGPAAGSTATALGGSGVNLAGDISFTNGPHSIEVNGLLNTSTISGRLLAANAVISKTGNGTLVLNNNNNAFSGSLNIAVGVLRTGVLGAIPNGSSVSITAGALLDVAGRTQVLGALSGGGAIGNSAPNASSDLYIGGTSTTDTTSVINSTFSGSITGVANPAAAISLVKVGAGTFTLGGTNTYRGATDVNSGTLQVSPSGVMTIGSNITVAGGATFWMDGRVTALAGQVDAEGVELGPKALVTGRGTFEANVNIKDNAILRPIQGVTSSFTIADNQTLSLDAGSTLLFAADAASKARVTIASAGQVLLSDGGWTLKLLNGGITNPQGMKFVLFDGDAAGSFNLNGNSVGSDDVGTVAYDWSEVPGWSLDPGFFDPGTGWNAGVHFDFDNNDIVLVGVIPEPSSSMLIGGALSLIAGFGRVRRRKQG